MLWQLQIYVHPLYPCHSHKLHISRIIIFLDVRLVNFDVFWVQQPEGALTSRIRSQTNNGGSVSHIYLVRKLPSILNQILWFKRTQIWHAVFQFSCSLWSLYKSKTSLNQNLPVKSWNLFSFQSFNLDGFLTCATDKRIYTDPKTTVSITSLLSWSAKTTIVAHTVMQTLRQRQRSVKVKVETQVWGLYHTSSVLKVS